MEEKGGKDEDRRKQIRIRNEKDDEEEHAGMVNKAYL